MKILILDEEFPYPLNTGKRIRSFNLLSRLARDHHVTCLAYGCRGSVSFEALEAAGMHPTPVDHRIPDKSGAGFYLRLLANLGSSLPYIVSSHYSVAFANALSDVLEKLQPDLVLCEWTPYAVFVKNLTQCPRVIAAHNIESQIWRRYYQNEANLIKRWYTGIQAGKVARFEKDALGWVDGATAVSEDEAATLREIESDLLVEIVANGVDTEYFSSHDGPGEPDTVVFTGSMDWRPNQDAISWYAEKILPLLRDRHPSLQTLVVGRKPPRHIRKLSGVSGIEVTGTVKDIRPYLKRAAVYIVPLRIGGGSRLKILEALAVNRAVVSTQVGAEGIKVADGEHLLLADTPKEFAAAVSRLFGDVDMCAKLGQAGRVLVEQYYGWDFLAAKLDKFLQQVVGR